MAGVAAAARIWKPEDEQRSKYPEDFLRWYKTIYNAAEGRLPEREIMLTHLVKVTCAGRSLGLVYRRREDIDRIKSFIEQNDIGGEWQIGWKFTKQ